MTVFYSYMLEVGDGLAIDAAAKRLLKSGIAETAAWPIDKDLALSPRYRRLAKIRDRALCMLAVEDFYSRDLRFRQLTPRARWILIKIQLGVLVKLFHRTAVENRSSNGHRDDLKRKMNETIHNIDRSMDELRFDPLLQCAVDRDLYRPGYLDSAPYVRLRLRSFQITPEPSVKWRVNDSDGKVWVRATLLLHRSGVAILCFEAEISPGAQTDELIPLLSGDRAKIYGSTICDPVVRCSARWSRMKRRGIGGVLLNEEMEGVKWRAYDHPGRSASLSEIFGIYREAVYDVLGRPRAAGTTLIYPTAFIHSLECCGDRKKWMSRHEKELVGIAGASIGYERFSAEARNRILGEDQSHTIGSSIWTTSGRSIIFWWDFREPDYNRARFRQLFSIVENALLKFWQLQSIDYRLTVSAATLDSVFGLQKSLVYGLDEVRQSQFSYGTASDISKTLFVQLGGEDLYSQLKDRSETFQQMISGRAARLASKRANRFALGAMIVAAILGLPAIRQSLDVVKSVGALQDLPLIGGLRTATSAGLDGIAMWVYAAVVVAMLLVVLLTVETRKNLGRPRRASRMPKLGYKWPGRGFSVVSRNRSDGHR
ncbi:hypothetical protein ABZX92_26215 [Lentzea sp. NPDC006480]|uniref:hypothetical protein n=1 Tax=Lentzea sp. NPDC006480 TaxID=3157176 RepID=UPI0033B4856F